ncbi:MAG: hypothetical protein ACWA44_02635 [Thiotrichales bacterium]
MDSAAYIAKLSQRGAKFGDCGRMCSECAFKQGSVANSEEWNTDAAKELLQTVSFTGLDGGQFNCHEQGTFQDAGVMCIGFKYAMQGLAMRPFDEID